jgi:hypothetical protein
MLTCTMRRRSCDRDKHDDHLQHVPIVSRVAPENQREGPREKAVANESAQRGTLTRHAEPMRGSDGQVRALRERRRRAPTRIANTRRRATSGSFAIV